MIITLKNVRPLFNNIVTTMDRYKTDLKIKGSNIINAAKSGAVKEYQKVIAVGPMVRGIEVGDTVFINPMRYAVMQHKEGSLKNGVITDNPVVGYNFDTVEIEGVEHLFLTDNDIKFIADVEEFEENPPVYIPDNPIIK